MYSTVLKLVTITKIFISSTPSRPNKEFKAAKVVYMEQVTGWWSQPIAGLERLSKLPPLRNLWRTPKHEGFLTMFSFTVIINLLFYYLWRAVLEKRLPSTRPAAPGQRPTHLGYERNPDESLTPSAARQRNNACVVHRDNFTIRVVMKAWVFLL